MRVQKALLYPLVRENVPLVRFRKLVEQEFSLEIVEAVSPPAYHAEGKDASYLDEGENTNFILSGDFDRAIEHCDCILLAKTEEWSYSEYLLEIVDHLITACKNHKNIYCTQKLPEPYHTFFQAYAGRYSVEFSVLEKKIPPLDINRLDRIYPIHTPILAVAGMNEDCGEFGLQLGLLQTLREEGYRVSYVGPNEYAEWTGGYAFPRAELETLPYSFEIKIKYLNAWFRNLEEAEAPDVILLGIPGGTMPIDEYNLNSCGYFAYLTGCAVTVDFTVLTIPCTEYQLEYLEQCQREISCRYHLPVDCMCLSNIQITPPVLEEAKTIVEKDVFSAKRVGRMMDLYREKDVEILEAENAKTYRDIVKRLYAKLG